MQNRFVILYNICFVFKKSLAAPELCALFQYCNSFILHTEDGAQVRSGAPPPLFRAHGKASAPAPTILGGKQMTRRNKRFLSLLLALTLAVSLCVLPAAAADQTCPSSKSDPVVFVHGLMGWGERAGLNSVLPYWGMTTGSLTAYLNSLGYETYSATVGRAADRHDGRLRRSARCSARPRTLRHHLRPAALLRLGHKARRQPRRPQLRRRDDAPVSRADDKRQCGGSRSGQGRRHRTKPAVHRRQEQLGALHDRGRSAA
mgnify:CR=1 FL=1